MQMRRTVKIAGLDTETTGLHPAKGDRIVEICVVKVDTEGKSHEVFEQRINPRKQISPEASAVHHIYNEDLEDAPFFEDIADELSAFLSDVDLLVCHNLAFDGEFIVSEYERVKKPVPDVQGFCTMETGRWATGTGKLPSLQELCFTCGINYDPEKAHAARYDVNRMLECLFVGLRRGWYSLKEET